MPIILNERLGEGVEYWRNVDATVREYWLTILSIEGEVAAAYAGLEPGDEVVFSDDVYGDDED